MRRGSWGARRAARRRGGRTGFATGSVGGAVGGGARRDDVVGAAAGDGFALGEPQPEQRGGARSAGGLDGARPLVREAGEHPGRLLEGAQRCAAGGLDGPAGPQVVDQLPGGPRRLVVEELPVDHHDRGEVAGRVALDVFEGDGAVLGGLAVADTEVLLELLEDGVAAHHRAQRVGADPDLVVTARLAAVHGVEGRDRGDLGGGQVEHLGAEADAGAGDVPLLGLDEVQQRQQRRARTGVAGDHLLGVRFQPGPYVHRIVGGGERGHPQLHVMVCRSGVHRSTPPITGSMDATATMTSATWPPSHIAAMAWRLVKDGSRKCTR